MGRLSSELTTTEDTWLHPLKVSMFQEPIEISTETWNPLDSSLTVSIFDYWVNLRLADKAQGTKFVAMNLNRVVILTSDDICSRLRRYLSFDPRFCHGACLVMLHKLQGKVEWMAFRWRKYKSWDGENTRVGMERIQEFGEKMVKYKSWAKEDGKNTSQATPGQPASPVAWFS